MNWGCEYFALYKRELCLYLFFSKNTHLQIDGLYTTKASHVANGETLSKWSVMFAAVRATPGRSLNNTRCRHCPNEKETLAHVLGSCPHGDTLRNSRHHKIRAAIAQALRNTGLTVFEEIHGISTTGSTRQIDIIDFKDQTTGYIIDPTVRLDYCKSQPDDVNEGKNLIYRPTIPYYSSVYKLKNI